MSWPLLHQWPPSGNGSHSMNSTKPTTSTSTKSETTRLLVPLHSLAIDFSHRDANVLFFSVCHTSAAGPTSIAQLKRVSSLFLFLLSSGGHQPVRSTCDAFSSVVWHHSIDWLLSPFTSPMEHEHRTQHRLPGYPSIGGNVKASSY